MGLRRSVRSGAAVADDAGAKNTRDSLPGAPCASQGSPLWHQRFGCAGRDDATYRLRVFRAFGSARRCTATREPMEKDSGLLHFWTDRSAIAATPRSDVIR